MLPSTPFPAFASTTSRVSKLNRAAIRKACVPPKPSRPFSSSLTVFFSRTINQRRMEVQLTAPNGKTWSQPTGLYIGGEFIKSSNDQKITSINPTNEEEICSVYAATVEDVDLAVAAARKAFKQPSWKGLSGTDRGHLLTRLAELVDQNKEILATVECLDNGKPYSEALNGDVADVVSVLKYYAGYADKNFGEVIDVGPGKFAYTLKQPLGVCGQIIPWNYPLAMAGWKLGPALCCGNTVVLKLAEQTPLSMLVMAKLIKEAGFPPGVVNIINGHGREAGAALVKHQDVDKIAFTGSTATGKEIMKMASGTLKNITLETGGKSPLIIFEDADVDLAATWAHVGIMSNQGQICSATSRVLVHEKVYSEFLEKFKATVQKVSVVGNPFEESTFQGPQVTKAQYDRVLQYIQYARDEGATIALGGEPALQNGKGFFINPTVFTDVKPNMKVFKEEIFGPCVSIVSFKTEEEAIGLANDTIYGLGAALFTRNLTRAHRVAAEIEAGMVWINSSNDSDVRIPFGGVKQSGIGRELGGAGLSSYYHLKAVHLNMES